MSENWAFFKQWLKHPMQLGTFLPISKKFAKKALAQMVKQHNLKDLSHVKVLELGAGTGRITKVLLDAGFTNITAIEIDPKLAALMEERFGDKVTVIQEDARVATNIFSRHHFDVIVSSLPFMYMPNQICQDIIDTAFMNLKQQGIFLHLCYTPSVRWFRFKNIQIAKCCAQWRHFPVEFAYEFKRSA